MVMRPCEPTLREVAAGWLAVAPPDYPYRIGVIGEDKDEARRRFEMRLAAWAELDERVSST
jgi:hypothetical protein